MSIVSETNEIVDRRNSPLNSRSQISDEETVLCKVQKSFALEIQRVTIAQNNRVGVRDTDGGELVAASNLDGTVDVALSV